MMKYRGDFGLGSASASRARFGALAEAIFLHASGKVRDREGAIASTRGACAPR
jgi:hypothetical protein